MKAAFSTWDNRIASVFDASNSIRLVEVESGKIVHSEQDTLPDDLPVQKALRLVELNADVLFCGAISRTMHDLIVSYGIRVIPFVAGALDEIVDALAAGRSDWTSYAMPGCMGRGRRRSTGGSGIFQKQGFTERSGNGGRRMGDAGGDCVCPQCGQRRNHRRGIPCFEYRCPTCGTPMMRG